jgi:hypothetical protein
VFTGRFGPGKGEVLFDRICRENGIRHLLTSPRSPTTTGKVERFHKTLRAEFLGDRVFASIEEAQQELDAWIEVYNRERPHQGIGMVPPVRRFALAQPEAEEQALPDLASLRDAKKHLTRRVGQKGAISLATESYHVGVYLSGETVDIALNPDGLIEIFHRGVLVAAHARRHRLDQEPATFRAGKDEKPKRPKLTGVPVIRQADSRGYICFAGTNYRVGNKHALKRVEVRVQGDTVLISCEGKLIRTHEARHDRQKEHGAFANPGGRPRKKASSF